MYSFKLKYMQYNNISKLLQFFLTLSPRSSFKLKYMQYNNISNADFNIHIKYMKDNRWRRCIIDMLCTLIFWLPNTNGTYMDHCIIQWYIFDPLKKIAIIYLYYGVYWIKTSGATPNYHTSGTSWNCILRQLTKIQANWYIFKPFVC